MTTARELVESALSTIGVKQIGQSVDPEIAQLGLTRLNDMLDAWVAESLYSFSTAEYVGRATAASVTLGPTGTIVVPFVPLRLENVFVRVGNLDYPVALVNYEQFAALSLKSLVGPWPSVGYYDGSGTLALYPVPSSVELHAGVYERLSQFASLNTDYALRPGTRRALSLSLAEDLSNDMGRPLDPNVERLALRARRILKRNNHVTPQLGAAYTTGFDLYPPGFSGDNYDGAIDNT
jgi:hypothetical protein